MKAGQRKTRTVAKAKTRLSAGLRLASEEEPTAHRASISCEARPEEEGLKPLEPRLPLGRWLVENMPRIGDLELPDRQEPDRPSPFEDWDFVDGDERGAEQ
jgi:hypothetical protein